MRAGHVAQDMLASDQGDLRPRRAARRPADRAGHSECEADAYRDVIAAPRRDQ